jgi:hypothetical protein
MRWFVLVLTVSASFAANLTLPEWLAPYPGATANTQASTGLIESSYTIAAKPADVAGHYQKELAAAGVESLVNDDGLGLAMRASASECDLLIRVRERNGMSVVSVSCSEKSSAPSQGTYLPNGKASPATAARPAWTTSAAGPGQVPADIKAKHDEIMANIRANMKKYDQPVSPEQAANPISLQWPSWFVTGKGADRGLQVQRKKYQSGLEYLESEYKTSAPMSEIYEYYQDLLRANGYKVRQSELRTGSTSTHVQQNASAFVEAAAYPNGLNNGSIVLHARMSRMFLNEPITVTLSVSVYQAVRSSRN